MNPIFYSYFNKHPMSWELIHLCLLHPSESVMTAMCCNKNLTGPPKQSPKKINQAPCTICYISRMNILPKGTTVGTTNLQLKYFIGIYFSFYNATSIQSFTSTIIAVCENTTILWIFTTASKRSPFRIIQFIVKIEE